MTVPITTKITDLLDTHHISYRRLPHTEPVFTVEAAAAQRGVVAEEMVKSILLREKSAPRRYVMACLLGPARLDPQAVRTHLSGEQEWKRLTFASAEEILAVTGYTQGAVAPLCLPADVPVIFDEAIARCTKVNISSGDLMLGLELSQEDLSRLAGAQFAPIATLPDTESKMIGISLHIDTGNVIYEEFTTIEAAIEFAKKYSQNPQAILERITPKKRDKGS